MLQGLQVEMWTAGEVSLPIFDIVKPPRNKVSSSIFKLLQMPQAKGKIIYAVKSALKTSCYTQVFCRIGCGNCRAMYEPAAGIWKKKKVHFSDSSTPMLPKYQFQEGCQEYIFHHTIPICSVNQIKRALWTFRAKSSSHHSSQWEMLKKGKELMWGGGEMGEEKRSC